MTVFIAILLTVLAFAFITYPLFKRRRRSVESVEDDKFQELHSKRDTTYSMLKELEFDFQSGILTEEDYHELEVRYKGKAISILRDIDDLGKDTNVEEEIEKQILGLRRSKGSFCHQCGTKSHKDDRFCSHCGISLGQGEAN